MSCRLAGVRQVRSRQIPAAWGRALRRAWRAICNPGRLLKCDRVHDCDPSERVDVVTSLCGFPCPRNASADRREIPGALPDPPAPPIRGGEVLGWLPRSSTDRWSTLTTWNRWERRGAATAWTGVPMVRSPDARFDCGNRRGHHTHAGQVSKPERTARRGRGRAHRSRYSSRRAGGVTSIRHQPCEAQSRDFGVRGGYGWREITRSV